MVRLSTHIKQLMSTMSRVIKSHKINNKGFISRSILNKKKRINEYVKTLENYVLDHYNALQYRYTAAN